jgi:small subunit ribosomal protein S25e
MGGGKKKQSIKQMTKPKAPKEKKQKSKKAEPETAKRTLGLTVPDVNNKKVIAELKGLKVLTPSIVASRYNIRLSLANAFLKELEKRNIIEYVSGGKNLKIYKRIEQVAQ